MSLVLLLFRWLVMSDPTFGSARDGPGARDVRSAFDLDDEGFVCAPRVFERPRVDDLRNHVETLFASPPRFEGDANVTDASGLRRWARYFDPLNRYPELAFVPFEPAVVGVLRPLLGPDYMLLPETFVQDSVYAPWERITAFLDSRGVDYHHAPDFKIVRCMLQLQDNDEAHGGGVDVQSGSHRSRDLLSISPKFAAHPVGRFFAQAVNEIRALDDERRKTTIRSRAGDLVVVHYNLYHRATPPTGAAGSAPASRKLDFVFSACANNAHTMTYAASLKARPEYRMLGNFGYTPRVHALAAQAGVQLLVP